jgi:hypothetical protein
MRAVEDQIARRLSAERALSTLGIEPSNKKRDVKMKERTEEVIEKKRKWFGTNRNEPGLRAVTSEE